MRHNFDAILEETFNHEGGYVDHPSDPGGATNMGITIGTLSDWFGRKATKTEVKNLSKSVAKAIYRKKYWDRVRGDDLPDGIDSAIFDFAVNSGVSRAVIYAQEIVDTAPDGKLGPITLKALQNYNASNFIDELCDKRLAFLKRLSTWKTFGKGWQRRVERVRVFSAGLVKPSAVQAPSGVTILDIIVAIFRSFLK